jgi:hypothetical protein
MNRRQRRPMTPTGSRGSVLLLAAAPERQGDTAWNDFFGFASRVPPVLALAT